jgi:hypothetical protein
MTSDRTVLFLVLSLAVAVIVCAIYSHFVVGKWPVAKLLNTGSALLGVASILQLRIVGWFDTVISEFGDEEKYPYGPPSYITRQIIDDPDHPVRTAIRNYFLFDANFGAHLAIVSLVVAMVAIWLD